MSQHRAKKRFGQHFLHDPAAIGKILAAINAHENEILVEIGPGLGAITEPLAATGAQLHCIEIDRDAVRALQEKFAGRKYPVLHQADALKFDLGELAVAGKLRVVGNLPYNISTPLLFHFLKYRTVIADLHFMLQREVVERACAEAGTPAYGRLSIMLAVHFRCENLFLIKPGAFSPPPKVDSAFMRLVPRPAGEIELHDPDGFAQLVRQAFSQRRKTLRNALKNLANPADLEACNLDPGIRPERVPPGGFVALANHLHAKRH